MTSGGQGASPRSARRVAGRPRYSRLTVRSPAPTRRRFTRSLAKAFSWQGWKSVAAVATSLVAISTAAIALQTFRVSQETLQANTHQQTSERFVKATEQLGNEKSPAVRIGGIYGLEQLARDSPSDHTAVFDVITAFVRGQVPAGTGKCADPSLNLDGYWSASPNARLLIEALESPGTVDRSGLLSAATAFLDVAHGDDRDLPLARRVLPSAGAAPPVRSGQSPRHRFGW
jgi:hypothetical protein